jgi:hypothetical protein
MMRRPGSVFALEELGRVTKPGMENYEGSHAEEYREWLEEAGIGM